jgi:prolyl oligopeptidase
MNHNVNNLNMKKYILLLMTTLGVYGNLVAQEDPYLWLEEVEGANLKPGMKYPEVFFRTSTKDDWVHPGHARKMVARMEEMGYTVYYFENTEGGHAGSSTNEQRARTVAQQYSFMLMKLRD